MIPTKTALGLCAVLLSSTAASAQVLASYDAGLAGSPAVAPDPTTVGWTLTYPLGTGVALSDLSPDGTTGRNAWVIADTGTLTGERAHYESLLTQQQVADLFQSGWELEIQMRVIQTAGFDIVVEYAEGQAASSRRYLAWYESAGADVLVTLQLSGTTYLCANAMDGNYHSFMYRKAGGAEDAEFYYDGQLQGAFPVGGANPGAPNGGVSFGSGSSGGTGTVHVNSVELRVLTNSGTAYCFGDGSGTTCPCGNPGAAGEGCANSSGAGGLLSSSGTNSVSVDDLLFEGSQLLPGQPALLFGGLNQVNSGAGILFGDGLRCAGGNIVRLGVRVPNASGQATWGPGLAASAAYVSGDTRNFQGWYRDPAGSPCGTAFNLTNGISVTFQP
jgi:hypothetical protein